MSAITANVLQNLENVEISNFSDEFFKSFFGAIVRCNKPLIVNRFVYLGVKYLTYERKFTQGLSAEVITPLVEHLVNMSEIIDPIFLDMIQM